MSRDDQQLLRLKLALYHALLEVENGDLAENEVDLMFHLCRDEQVQAHIQKHLKDSL